MRNEEKMPKEGGLDHSLKLLKEGYEFIINRRQSMSSNVFQTRLLGQKAVCLTGSEAAKLFYDETRFRRADSAPLPVKKTLFGQGGVQGLDDEEHRHRKCMFMQLGTPEATQEIRHLTKKHWERALEGWQARDEILLYEESKKILTRMICEWAGVPLDDEEVDKRADQLSELFESPARANLGHFKGWVARSEAETWISDLVGKVRNDDLNVDKDRALYKFSWHEDREGELLAEKVVAVEILNVLRPTVANAVWINFLVLAVHNYPQKAEGLRRGQEDHLQWFVQEVRRYYPFFPFAAARVRKDFTWKNYEFEEGTLTLLDLYGTNRHPNDWREPEVFAPERFADWDGNLYNFIPQGGGEYKTGHRCAGEWITLAVLTETLDFLINTASYTLPQQDLSFSLSDIPSRPKSGIRMTNLRRR